ncbi:urea transporter 1-like isoform X2 [Cheilinus undulatus]|uniref:urea transporter 1-like isoform X2 n=1 Tax=Cheilinus undulatus TaxID=241271 RepID=UPI001BD508EE|nr:urea transporter 1-like isoform X2 [Cheilinus undulatus]
MDNNNQPSHGEAPARSFFFRAVGLFTGDMKVCREWVKRQVFLIQLLDWIFRGVAQVMFVNNPLSGLLITIGLFLQNPWWALNGLLGTLISTGSALLLGQNRSDCISLFLCDYRKINENVFLQALSNYRCLPLVFPGASLSFGFTLRNFPSASCLIVFCTHVGYICHTRIREAISAGLYGYNGTLVGMLMAVFSAKGSWYWWLLLPNMFMSMLCPVVSSALSSVASKWDLPIFTLPFNILVCQHIAATGANHPFFPEVDFQSNHLQQLPNDSIQSLNISQLLLSVPVGVGQVYGCGSPWTGGLILLALLLSSPTICFHAMLGSVAGTLSGIFCAHMMAALSKLMSMLALPACTWPFCLSTLIFLLISSEIPAICRLPLSVVSYPEENRHYQKQLKALEKAQGCQQRGGQEEAELKENGGLSVHLVVEKDSSE